MAVAGIDAVGTYVTVSCGRRGSMAHAAGLDLTQRYALAHEVLRNTLALTDQDDLRVAAAVPDTATDPERVAHRDAILAAGMPFVCLRNRSVAACLGAGLVYEGSLWAGHPELSDEPFERLVLDVLADHMRLSWMSSQDGISDVLAHAEVPASPAHVPALLEVWSEEQQGRVVPLAPVIVADGGGGGGAILDAVRGFCAGLLDDSVPPDMVVAKGMWEVTRLRSQPVVLR